MSKARRSRFSECDAVEQKIAFNNLIVFYVESI